MARVTRVAVVVTEPGCFGVPPHLLRVIERINADLYVAFGLDGKPAAVPYTIYAKQGHPPSPALFLFFMKVCLGSPDKAMLEEASFRYGLR